MKRIALDRWIWAREQSARTLRRRETEDSPKHFAATELRARMSLAGVLSTVVPVALLLWLVLITARGVVLAVGTFRTPPFPGFAPPDYMTPSVLWAAVLVYGFTLLAALAVRSFRPAMTLPVTFAAGGLVFLAGAATSRSLGALIPSLAMLALSWLLGDVLLRRLPVSADVPIVRAPIAIALGLGLLGLLLFGLAALQMLEAVTVIAGACALLALLLLVRHRRLAEHLANLRSWRPLPPTWWETVMIGISTGLIVFSLLSVFVPETVSDAIWLHLPIAREIWQTGAAPEFAFLEESREPIQAQLLYAVAYGFGGIAAPKGLHALMGLLGIVGVAGIGWLVAGRAAAVASAAIFASMPLTLWLLGHALIDFFPIVFMAAAVLCILLWQRDGLRYWLICAGALAGFGLVTKQNMALLIVALAAAIFLVGRGPWEWRERIVAVVSFGLGTVVAVPWLLRSYGLTGTISPLLAILTDRLNRYLNPGSTPVATVTTLADFRNLPGSALGDSPLELLRVPWFFTFHAEQHRFLVVGRGEIGFLLLLLLPLVLFAPRTRAVAALAVITLASYVGWWITPFQIIRHLLPTLAIAAALAGIAVASVLAGNTHRIWNRSRELLATGARLGVVVGLAASPLLFLPGLLTRLPIDLIMGRETVAAYLTREVRATAALAAASAMLPPDTVVGYIGKQNGGAQIYTEARLLYFAPASLDTLGTTPPEILDGLEALGIDYFIWDRAAQHTPEDWRSAFLSAEFLRGYTRILEGDRGGYLFEILPAGDLVWGEKRTRNRLQDPDLKRVAKPDGPWQITGAVDATRGAVPLRAGDSVSQRVPVSGGVPYLLVTSSACAEPADRSELTLHWFDAQGAHLSTDQEPVTPGTMGSEQFLWHRAPELAASAVVELTARSCEVNGVTLYELS